MKAERAFMRSLVGQCAQGRWRLRVEGGRTLCSGGVARGPRGGAKQIAADKEEEELERVFDGTRTSVQVVASPWADDRRKAISKSTYAPEVARTLAQKIAGARSERERNELSRRMHRTGIAYLDAVRLLLAAFSERGDLVNAEQMLRRCPHATTSDWNHVVSCAGARGGLKAAESATRLMNEHGVAMDSQTMTILLCLGKDLTEALDDVRRLGLSPRKAFFADVLRRYVHDGNYNGCLRFFRQLFLQNIRTNHVSLTWVLAALLLKGDHANAERILTLFDGSPSSIDPEIFDVMSPRGAVDLLLAMMRAGHVNLTRYRRDVLGRLLGEGEYDELLRIPCENDPVSWRIRLSADVTMATRGTVQDISRNAVNFLQKKELVESLAVEYAGVSVEHCYGIFREAQGTQFELSEQVLQQLCIGAARRNLQAMTIELHSHLMTCVQVELSTALRNALIQFYHSNGMKVEALEMSTAAGGHYGMLDCTSVGVIWRLTLEFQGFDAGFRMVSEAAHLGASVPSSVRDEVLSHLVAAGQAAKARELVEQDGWECSPYAKLEIAASLAATPRDVLSEVARSILAVKKLPVACLKRRLEPSVLEPLLRFQSFPIHMRCMALSLEHSLELGDQCG